MPRTRPEPVLLEVTPDMAREWLAGSRTGRVFPEKVARFAADMAAGRWVPNRHRYKPIVLDGTALANGNHRLNAVVAYGRPVRMWVRGEATADDA